ncbi:MAG: GNVR domain-containing protein [Gemmatimonadota bacterium]|nr:GNVR domain-containing protein [Gemmatimonadota bacterium]
MSDQDPRSPRTAPDGVPGSGPLAAESPASDSIGILGILVVFLRYRRAFFGLPVILAAAFLLASLLLPSRFTATSAFLPEAAQDESGLPAGLVGLAGQFGVTVPVGGSSPQLYRAVLESRSLRDDLLLSHFAHGEEDAALIDILGVDGDDQPERMEKGRKTLEKRVAITLDAETGIVSVSVETRHPPLSAAVANRAVDLVSSFDLVQRHSHARERRTFVESRLRTAEAELESVEHALMAFMEANRLFQENPRLQFEHDRLERRVSIKQEVFTTLHRELEEARIQEVNDTPVITVIDQATAPRKRSSPNLPLNAAAGLLLGVVLAFIASFGREFLLREEELDPDTHSALTGEMRSLPRSVRQLLGGRRT